MPGGNFAVAKVEDLIQELKERFAFLTDTWARRLVRAYGMEAAVVLGSAKFEEDLGRNFGGTLFEAEVFWLMKYEFAMTAEDILWRRSKLGLRLTPKQTDELNCWMASARSKIS